MTKRAPPTVSIDWDTVELVEVLSTPPVGSTVIEIPSSPRRPLSNGYGRSLMKKILSGAAMKARGRGALYTHAGLRRELAGWQKFLYGCELIAAAIASDHDLARAVEMAARSIEVTSARLVERRVRGEDPERRQGRRG